VETPTGRARVGREGGRGGRESVDGIPCTVRVAVPEVGQTAFNVIAPPPSSLTVDDPAVTIPCHGANHPNGTVMVPSFKPV